MKIYDSLTNQKINLDKNKITIYNCGPTVYNDVHIGNVRPLIIFDVLYRFLNYKKISVQYIHNITDIDDKIIDAAEKLNKNELDFSNFYFEQYLKILKALNIKEMIMPKISENINGIISYIKKLIDSKNAYVLNGDVYFDIKTIKQYGILSKQNIDFLLDGVRKENKLIKKSQIDFTLWKKTTKGITWDSPWSKGRPGWHTECAFLINKYFGDHVNIHGGGIDLKFPHHENENVQNIALNGRNIADVWMHIGHIKIDNEKMAKSSGNFILVKDLLKTINSNVIRWFMYQTQYENPINFSVDYINQLNNDFNKLNKSINQTFIDLILKEIEFKKDSSVISTEFIEYLENDLNMPNALKVIWSQTKLLRESFTIKKYEQVPYLFNSLINSLNILGIDVLEVFDSENINRIKQWKEHIKNKEYKSADEIRNFFKNKEII